ncbi:serine hydrolase [Nocardia sp. XZ_19_385]|uniref:serine hydrolase domain-containing protein n=1 Tax=Nocardia sp. XZ_19_385 TaxID=2769488 RepID=UPI001E4D4482|nr:serine hydrolase domain-containing protein [Nocardia sp. XZ_19_385]
MMQLDLTRIRELLSEYGIPSAAIGVLHDGRITEFAVGVKDVSTGEPATTDTVYQLGSITKTFTALAFMQFVDEGKIGLDDPIRDYLPDFSVADPQVTAEVTARHLLNHTHGIEEAFGDPGEDADVYARMVANITDAPQVFPLGETHGYSTALGYALLARLMEVLDGRPWDDLVRERLLTPMGLSDTSTRHEQVDPDRAATGHLLRSLDEGPIHTPLPHLPRSYGPAGNFAATLRDLLAVAHVFLNNGEAPNGTRIVSPAAIQEMTTSRVPVPDPYMFGPEWALGLIVCDWSGHTVYATDGSTVGQNARLRILPGTGTAIALLANGGPRETFYQKVFHEILTTLDAPILPDLPKPDPDLVLDLSRYEGVYERPGTRYVVHTEAGRLHLTLALDPMHAQFLGKPDHLRYELLPISETHFLMPPTDPLEDPQTVAIYDFRDGPARYLHTNCRVHPRAGR